MRYLGRFILFLVFSLFSLAALGLLTFQYLSQNADRNTPSQRYTPLQWPQDTTTLAAKRAPSLALAKDTFELSVFKNPSRQYYPWLHWWWPNSTPTEQALTHALQQMASQHFGGFTIQAIQLSDKEKFDRAQFYNKIVWLAQEAQKHELSMDLAFAGGFGTGGVMVAPEDGLQSLAFGEMQVRGGRIVSRRIPPPQKTWAQHLLNAQEWVEARPIADYNAKEAQLVAVLAFEEEANRRRWNPLAAGQHLQLASKTVKILTDKVDAQGRLYWAADPGMWRVIVVYQMPASENIAHSPTALQGWALQVLDSAIVSRHWQQQRQALQPLTRRKGALRAIRQEGLRWQTPYLWHPQLLEIFERQNGYSLLPYLPLLAQTQVLPQDWQKQGAAKQYAYRLGSTDERIRYDYERLRSELWMGQFLNTSLHQAHQQGWLLRSHIYPQSIDLLQASGLSDLPEMSTEMGQNPMAAKLVSSGAHLHRKPLVAATVGDFPAQPYAPPPQKLKIAIDRLLLSGANQLSFKGFYTTGKGIHESSSEAITGTDFSARYPYYQWMPAINQYVARCQYVLQQGAPETDVLIYHPFLDFPLDFDHHSPYTEMWHQGRWTAYENTDTPANAWLPEWLRKQYRPSASAQQAWYEQVWQLIQTLENQGYTWSWVNDERLQDASVADSNLIINGLRYKALILSGVDAIPYTTADKLAKLNNQGLAILSYGAWPSRHTGFHQHQSRDKTVGQAMGYIANHTRSKRISQANQLLPALQDSTLRVYPALAYLAPYPELRHTTRRLGAQERLVFLQNSSSDSREFILRFERNYQNYYLLNPMNGLCAALLPDSSAQLRLRLAPYESVVFYVGKPPVPLSVVEHAPWEAAFPQKPDTTHLLTQWTLSVQSPKFTQGFLTLVMRPLTDWREQPQLGTLSEVGVYLNKLVLAQKQEDLRYYLDLGQVGFGAEVQVNAQKMPLLWALPYRLDITEALQKGNNRIIVKVRPSGASQMPAGLIGPVKLLLVRTHTSPNKPLQKPL
jgi:hypothetical protein